MDDVNTRKQIFLFLNSEVRINIQGNILTFEKTEQTGIITTKFKRTRDHFVSDISVVITVEVA